MGDLFDIDNTLSFNTDKLVPGEDYDYITRTSFNQGILQTTGFVNAENINPSGTWSLGLLQMDFFYRSKPWYAGQFVRKITPKIEISKGSVLFFTSLLNKQKKKLLSALVRNVDETFKAISIKLPITSTGKINFDFMDSFIAKLEAGRVTTVSSYLKANGLNNYELTNEEQTVINNYHNVEFKGFDLIGVFDVKNTSNILSCDITENSGETPYLCASEENNSVSSYIKYDEKYLEKGNCIFIGGKTFVVSYQEKNFFSNDSHNLALYLKNHDATKLNQLYLATCVYKSLCHKYSWGNSVSKAKIKTDKIYLPVKDNKPDYDTMELLISAVHKLVIKDVVLYADKKMKATKQVLNAQNSDN